MKRKPRLVRFSVRFEEGTTVRSVSFPICSFSNFLCGCSYITGSLLDMFLFPAIALELFEWIQVRSGKSSLMSSEETPKSSPEDASLATYPELA